MSGSFRRRHSKWDHKDSEALTENFQDKAQTRRPREPFSPSRGSQRHDSRSKERMMTWDSEGNNARMSTGPDESRQHLSRSPRNGWGRLRSRSRSRSRSPSHHLRREPAVNDRSRSRSGVSAQVCREFVAGRCRRESTCHFLHQDAQPYDTNSRQPLDSSQSDDWEARHRRVGGSKYSPVDTKDSSPRTEKSVNICSEFLKRRCRRGASCRFEHRDPDADSFKEDLIDDSHRDRDISHKSRDIYFHQNHDREPVDVFEKGHVDDRDSSHRTRDTYSHRNHGQEPVDLFEKGHVDDRHNSHRTRDTHSNRIHGREPADMFEKGHADDRGRDNSHRRRDTYSHRDHDREPVDVFEKGLDVLEKGHVDDRDRGNSRRSRDTYPHRNHDREPDVFVKGPIDDMPALRDRENPHRSRDSYSHRNHDREHSKVFEKRPVDDFHRDKDRDSALRSRDTFTHRNHDREPADLFEKKPVDDFHRDRDNPRKIRDTYQNHDHDPVDDAYRDRDNDHRVGDAYRDHDREPHKRGGTLCKFFASGNCRNGDHCRFVHEVRERLSPERRPQADAWGADHKIESNQVWDGPSLSDMVTLPNNAPLRGWGEEKNEVVEKDMVSMKETQVTPVGNDEFQMQVENPPLQWETEKSVPNMGFSASRGVVHVSGDMVIPPMNSNSHAPSLSNVSFATSQQIAVSEAFHEKPCPTGFQDFPMQNSSHEEENPNVYHEEGRNVIPTVSAQPNSGIIPFSAHFPNQIVNTTPQQGFLQADHSISVQPSLGLNFNAPHFPSSTMNLPPQQSFFQTDQNISVQPSSCLSAPAPQAQVQFPSETSYFLNSITSDGPNLVNATPSELVSATAASLSTVSNEQLAQLSNLTASLAQILENQQQLPQLASITPALHSTMQTNQVDELSKQQYDPICDSLDQNMHDSSDPSENKILEEEGGNRKQQETVIVSKDDEKVQKIAEESKKDPENRPTEDEGDDGNKSKDTKAVRPFKFALAEFVKELLKPFWKDGQVNKDAYKTIVKKVVDKIIETQGLQIPQTKEKIDNYLSCSKPKIDKLVQAYVGKFQKT